MAQTESDPLCVCVSEATDRRESLGDLKCGKAAQFLPGQEWGEQIFWEHQCLVACVGPVLQSGCCPVQQGGDPWCHEFGTGWRHPPAQQWLEIRHCDQDKGSGIWKGGAEGNLGWEGCAFCVVSPECSSSASVNITLASALVTVSVWFCTQIFRAAVHNKLDGAWFKSTDFSSLLTQSRMSPCAPRASSMKGTVDMGC